MIPRSAPILACLILIACARDASEPAPIARSTGLEIVAVDFGFQLDQTELAAGDVRTTLTNDGREPHQAGYFLLNEGVTYERFVESILKDDTQIPTLATGGRAGVVRSVSPGDTYTRPSDELEPGEYVLLCSIRDPKTGKNHYELGMVAQVSVK